MASGSNLLKEPSKGGSKSWDSPDQIMLDLIRRKITFYGKMGRYSAAEFWIDKIANLSDYQNLADLLEMCEYLFMDGQYEACRRIIERRSLHEFTSGDLDEALKVTAVGDKNGLDDRRSSLGFSRNGADPINFSISSFRGISMDEGQEGLEYLAAIQVLRGRIFDKLENPQNASQAYQRALELDPYSYDALEQLAIRKAMSNDEQNQFIRETSENCSDGESLIQVFYENQLSMDNAFLTDLDWETSKFANNPDVLIAKADRLLTRRDFVSCLEVTQKIFEAKPFYRRALPIHIAALVHLGKSSQLFDLSHRLVTLYPQEVLAWYATASYYFVCGHMDLTRRHLSKAISLDKSCGYVWLLYGHSFSREKEHDQAMAAYFHAVDVMRGSYFPYLYIAREYARTNNYVLAERFYEEARKLACEDPIVLHELGILHIKKSESSRGQAASLESRKDLNSAAQYLNQALTFLKMDSRHQKMMDQAVEGIYESLAATHLKLKDAKEALRFAQLAFQINATNSTVLKLMGMAHVMLGQTTLAVDTFQRSLAVGRDDQQTKKMLSETVEMCVLEGVSSTVPLVDLTVKRKTRVAKAPAEVSRTTSKRVNKKDLNIVSVSATNGSAMDMSIGSTNDPSFVGEFRAPSGTIENVSMEYFDDV